MKHRLSAWGRGGSVHPAPFLFLPAWSNRARSVNCGANRDVEYTRPANGSGMRVAP
jgi:hypothetical protein